MPKNSLLLLNTAIHESKHINAKEKRRLLKLSNDAFNEKCALLNTIHELRKELTSATRTIKNLKASIGDR